MKNCAEYEALLSAYLDGELALGKQEEIRRHLEECSSCGEAFRRLQEVVNWTSALPMVSPPGDLKERILSQTVYRQEGGYPWKGVAWGRRIWIPAVGTAVLLGLFGWYSLQQGVKQPVISQKEASSPPKVRREKVYPPREPLVSPQVPSKNLTPETEKGIQRERTEQVAELTFDQSVRQVDQKRLVLSKEGGGSIRSVLKGAWKRKGALYERMPKEEPGKGVSPTPKAGRSTQDQESQPKEQAPIVDEIKGSTPPSLPPTPEPASEPTEAKKNGEGMLASVADHPPEVVPSSTHPPMTPLWPGSTAEEQSQEVLRRLQKRWGSSEERILKVDLLRIQF